MSRGQPAKAVVYADRLVALQRKHSPQSLELSDALVQRSGVHMVLSQFGKATADLTESQALINAHKPLDLLRFIQMMMSTANIFTVTGKEEQAAKIRGEICKLAEKSGDSFLLQLTSSDCVAAAWASGDLQKAENMLELRVAELERKTGKTWFWANAVHELAKVSYALGKKDAAIKYAKLAADFDELRLRREIGGGTDEQKRAKFNTYRVRMNEILSLGAAGGGSAAATQRLVEKGKRARGEGLLAQHGADGADAGAHAELLGEHQHLDELRMDGRLAAGEVQVLHAALGVDAQGRRDAAPGHREGLVARHAVLLGAEHAALGAGVGQVQLEPLHASPVRPDPRLTRRLGRRHLAHVADVAHADLRRWR
jgi:hypothetical protein